MASASQFQVDVYVTLKSLVNDPEGNEIMNGLRNLGYDSVSNVRSGRYFQVIVEADSADQARCRVDEMCQRLLCNTVIEEYRMDVGVLSTS